MVAEDGTEVEGNFTWKTPWDKPDAGTCADDVILSPPTGGRFPAVDVGQIQVTVARAAVNITWQYNGKNLHYNGKSAVVTPPELTISDGKPRLGTIA